MRLSISIMILGSISNDVDVVTKLDGSKINNGSYLLITNNQSKSKFNRDLLYLFFR